jgi:hypothetical protein
MTIGREPLPIAASFAKVVIPAKAGIQYFQDLLDAPVSSTGQAPQVRHDGGGAFINRL